MCLLLLKAIIRFVTDISMVIGTTYSGLIILTYLEDPIATGELTINELFKSDVLRVFGKWMIVYYFIMAILSGRYEGLVSKMVKSLKRLMIKF